MNLHLIYWTFLQEVARASERKERYVSIYYEPNKPFLQNYLRFWAGMEVEEILAKFDDFYPLDLLDSLESLFPLEKTKSMCQDLLRLSCCELELEGVPDVYLMVGVYTSNAFTTFVAGQPMVGLCLEHFDHRPKKHPRSLGLAPEVLPVWFFHEMAHCARWSEDSRSPMRKALEQAREFSWAVISGRIPLVEFLWSEGVAVAFSLRMSHAPLHVCLGFTEEKLAFCREKEKELWQKFLVDMDRTDLEAYSKWFEGSELIFEKKIPPERAGYYLGYRAVETMLDKRGVDWASLCRLGLDEVSTVLKLQNRC